MEVESVGKNKEITFKILILGDSNVGKTCLIHRYCDKAFFPNYISTIGIDCKQHAILLGDQQVQLRIWDTAGQERFRTLTTAYYRGAQGIVLVYDITNPKTFEHLSYWMKNIAEMSSPQTCQVLVGNKCDLEDDRSITVENGKKLAEKFGVPFWETSCKTGQNVEDVIMTLATKMKDGWDKKKADQESFRQERIGNVIPSAETESKKKWCAC